MHPSARTRALAWLYTGPLGHLYGGVADVAEMLTRWLWGRLRARAGRSATARARP